MKFEFHDPKLGSIFGLTDDIKTNETLFSVRSGNINMLWNRNSKSVLLEVDGIPVELHPNQVMTTTYLQHVSFHKSRLPITAFLFNREFYCIQDHDSEVSCTKRR